MKVCLFDFHGVQARREKISERMKILQDLVPGCNKVSVLTYLYTLTNSYFLMLLRL